MNDAIRDSCAGSFKYAPTYAGVQKSERRTYTLLGKSDGSELVGDRAYLQMSKSASVLTERHIADCSAGHRA